MKTLPSRLAREFIDGLLGIVVLAALVGAVFVAGELLLAPGPGPAPAEQCP